jgi:hypothetical protein
MNLEEKNLKKMEEMFAYLLDNYDTIKELVEKEKNRPKAVFGFKAGGVFNKTNTDELWGSDFKTKDDEPLGEALTLADVPTKVDPTKEKPQIDLYSNPEVESEIHRKPKGVLSPTDIIEEEPTEEETNDDAPTNDTTDSSAPDTLLRDEDEAAGERDDSITSEPRGVEDSNDSNEARDDEGSRDRETRGLEDRREGLADNPWHKHRTTKTSGFTFTEKTAQDNQNNINHDSFYEHEYKERCEKKGWEYKSKEQRHEEAKAGAEKIRNNRERPFNDFRKLW